jgi:hypothetical protein
MAVLQPLYFAGGRYTASTDRKLLTALIDPESGGVRTGGVIPPVDSMQVSISSGLTISVDTGFCVIPDTGSGADSPGLHLCAIDSSVEQMTLTSSGTTRTDLIYASVDENFYTVIGKSSDGTDATLTTSANHGFKVGQTVFISGVDNFFDGSYVLIAGTTASTIKYARAGTYTAPANQGLGATVSAYVEYVNASNALFQRKITNKEIATNLVTLTTDGSHSLGAGVRIEVVGVSNELDGVYETVVGTATNEIKYIKVAANEGSTPVTQSFVARARVPFAIKVEVGVGGSTVPTLPAGTNLALASVLVTGSAATSVADLRKFTTGLGGVYLYNSNIPGVSVDPLGVQGRLRYDTHTNKLEVYDTTGTAGWRTFFQGSTGHHDSVSVDASPTALHHTLGTGANQASRGNHIHGISNRLAVNDTAHSYVGGGGRITSENSAAPTILASSGAVNIPANTWVMVIAVGWASVSAADANAFLGIRLGGGIEVNTSIGETNGRFNITCMRYFYFGGAANGQVFELGGWMETRATTADNFTVNDVRFLVLPFSPLATNTYT